MNDEDKLHEQILELEMENHRLKQRLVEHEYEQFSLQSIQKLAKAGSWKLNHLSYHVSLSTGIIDILGLDSTDNPRPWDEFTAILSPDNKLQIANQLIAPLNATRTDPYLYLDYTRPDGTALYLKHFSKTFFNTIGQPLKTVGLVQDVTEERRQANILKQHSITDELTGLYNRRQINEVLLQELNNRHSQFSVILLDLDYFKQINDSFGHLLGDKVLKYLAKLLKQHLPAPIVSGRWGGEEFLILLPASALSHANQIAAQIKLELGKYRLPDGKPVTASYGVTQRQESDDIHTLLSRVDHLMYAAKQSGRNRICSDSCGFDDMKAYIRD